VNTSSVLDFNSPTDGHVNRNIRLALALIDLSKPSIEIVSYSSSDESGEKITVKWRVNGCHTLEEAYALVNGVKS